jgi:hypothetical protein
VEEGYGGQPIQQFPPYKFFIQYLEGHPDSAKQDYFNWYREQFKKYFNLPKQLGGMYNGSLYKLIEQEHKGIGITLNLDLSNMKVDILEATILKRVAQRFALLEKIRTKGFLITTDIIYVSERDGFFYLKGGHHRCAVLTSLGHSSLPVVVQ